MACFVLTLHSAHPHLSSPKQVFGFLRKHIHDEATVEEVKRVTLTADGRGACFDVPTNLAKVGGCLQCCIPGRLSLHMGVPTPANLPPRRQPGSGHWHHHPCLSPALPLCRSSWPSAASTTARGTWATWWPPLRCPSSRSASSSSMAAAAALGPAPAAGLAAAVAATAAAGAAAVGGEDTAAGGEEVVVVAAAGALAAAGAVAGVGHGSKLACLPRNQAPARICHSIGSALLRSSLQSLCC